jgi:hypothetical protein
MYVGPVHGSPGSVCSPVCSARLTKHAVHKVAHYCQQWPYDENGWYICTVSARYVHSNYQVQVPLEPVKPTTNSLFPKDPAFCLCFAFAVRLVARYLVSCSRVNQQVR